MKNDPLKDVLGLGSNVLDFLKEAGKKVIQGLSGGAQQVGQALQQAPARISQTLSTPSVRDLISNAAKSAAFSLPPIAGARAAVQAVNSVPKLIQNVQQFRVPTMQQAKTKIQDILNTPIPYNSPLGKFAQGIETANRFLTTAPVISDIGYKIPKQAGENTANLIISAAEQAKTGKPSEFLGFRIPAKVAVPAKAGMAALNLTPIGVAGTYASEIAERSSKPIFGEKSPIPTGLGLVAGLLVPGGEAQDAARLSKLDKLAKEAQQFKSAGKFTKALEEGGRLEEVTNLLKGTKLGESETAIKDFFKFVSKGESEIQTLIERAKVPVKTTTQGFTQVKDVLPKTPEEVVAKAGDLLNNTADDIVQGIKARVKPRKFLQTVQESPATGEKLAEEVAKIKPQEYVQVTNKAALKQADDLIKNLGFDGAKAQVLDFKTPVNEVKTALGVRLAETAEGQGRVDEAVDIVENLDRQLREAGRFIQAASLWDRLSPEAMVRAADRAAEKVGLTLSNDIRSEIIQKVMDVRKLPEADRQNAMMGVLNFVAEKLPPTKGELFDAYRYQNMLSGLKTNERNIYQNLFNTLITRPLDMIGASAVDFVKHPFNVAARDFAMADVPKYYQNVFAHTGDAIAAAKEAFKMLPSSAKFEDVGGATAISALRRANMAKDKTGKYVTVIPRFLEAQDKFFSTLIGAGEQARLMAKGLDEGQAIAQAKSLAEKYLLREQLGSSKDQATLVRALDSLGQFAMKGRNLPVVGKPYSWFVPFITTPINAAKVMVEHSPLGLLKNEGLKPGVITDTEQLGKAAVGSVVTAWGAMLAAQDRVTWDAPTDPQAKELFYASGRKPYSVKIGDTWTPMWYFGAFALPLAIPAAAKYYSEESRTAPTDDGIAKLVNIAGGLSKFLMSQTPMQGVSGFFRMLDGDEDTSLASQAGFSVSQALPLSALVSYVNTIIDPVYRKSKGFMGSIQKAIPFGTLNQPAYTTPTGEPSTRLPANYLLPYDVGRSEPGYELPFQERQTQLQSNAILNDLTKSIEENSGGGGIFGNLFGAGGGKTSDNLDISQFETPDLASALKKKESLKKVNDYMALYYKTGDEKLRSQIEQTVTKYGLSFQDANYNYISGLDTNSKVTYLENQLDAGTLDHNSLITVLREGRKESLNDDQFATNAVLDDLYDLDYITDAERKALKKLRINVKGEVIGGGGASGASRGTSGAGKKTDTYIASVIKKAQDEIISSLKNPPEIGSVTALSKETKPAAQQGVKIPQVQTDVVIKPRQVLTSGDVQAMINRARKSSASGLSEEAQRILASLRGGGSTGSTPAKLSQSFFRVARA